MISIIASFRWIDHFEAAVFEDVVPSVSFIYGSWFEATVFEDVVPSFIPISVGVGVRHRRDVDVKEALLSHFQVRSSRYHFFSQGIQASNITSMK